MEPGDYVWLKDKSVSSNNVDWQVGIVLSWPTDYAMPEVTIALAGGTEITEYVEHLERMPATMP